MFARDIPPAVVAGRRPCLWLAYVVACAAAAAAGAVALRWPAAWAQAGGSLLHDAVVASAPVAVAAGIRRHRPERPQGWQLAAAAVALAAAADIGSGLAGPGLPADRPYLFSAVLHAAGFLLAVAALLLLIHARSPGRDRAGVLEALIVAVGLGMLAWALVVRTYSGQPAIPVGENLTTLAALAAPLLDVVLVVLAVRLAAGGRAPALRLLLAGLVGRLVADAAAALLVADTAGPAPPYRPETLSTITFALLGAAALHPSMRAVNQRTVPSLVRLTRTRIVLLFGVALFSPTVLAAQAAAGHAVSVPVLLVGTGCLFALVVGRMCSIVGEERARASLQELVLDRIVRATEQERSRIAADLHDGPIQRLTRVSISAEVVRHRLERGDPEGGRRLLSALERQVGEEVHTLRRLMVELHPPALDDLGLSAALTQYASEFTRRTGTACKVAVEHAPPLDASREAVVYRVVQEALNNIDKHAAARTVVVALNVDGQTARLDVRDDGVGFAADSAGTLLDHRHFGLVAMRQRVVMAGGTLEIRSRPGVGTVVTAHLPLLTPEQRPTQPAER